MAVKKERVISFVYQKVMRSTLKLIDINLIGPTTKFQLTYQSTNSSAYTMVVGKEKDTFRVMIGGGMVAKVAMLPNSFSSKSSLKPYIVPIKAAFKGLNYHEMGHVLFTDMTLTKLLEYDLKYRGFVLQLFNIIEDPIIEFHIIKHVEKTRPYDKSPRIYIDYIKKQIFAPQCEEYKDNGDLTSFMNYLLLVLRCGKSAIKNTNAVYEKYSANIIPMVQAALKEPDATERQVKVVELADWIIKNVEEFDWSALREPDDLKPAPKGASTGAPMPSGMTSKSMPSLGGEKDDTPGDGTPGGGGEEGSEEEDSPGGTEKPGEDDKEKDEGEDEEESEDSEGEFTPEDVEDTDVPEIDDCFEDLINSSYDHEFIIAKDEYTIANEERLLSCLDDQLEKSTDCIQNISKFLTLFRGRRKPRRTSGFTTGRLNILAAMQDEARDGCETKLFTRDIARGKMADLGVSLVCDNSGSMVGGKSMLASVAALALAQACDWSKIPFECSCFTKTNDNPSGTSITIIEKEFDEPFIKAKPYFGINDSNLIGYLKSERSIPTFRGNSEEVNLFYIGREFAKTKFTSKLMFVFCDGATTGSKESLRKVIQKMEMDGIHVIGIGLMARDVAAIYPHYKIFNNLEDMQNNLAPYLVETLSKFATK